MRIQTLVIAAAIVASGLLLARAQTGSGIGTYAILIGTAGGKPFAYQVNTSTGTMLLCESEKCRKVQ